MHICTLVYFYPLLYIIISILSYLQSWYFNICKSLYLHNCIHTSYKLSFLRNYITHTFVLKHLNALIIVYSYVRMLTLLYHWVFAYLETYMLSTFNTYILGYKSIDLHTCIITYLHDCIFAYLHTCILVYLLNA